MSFQKIHGKFYLVLGAFIGFGLAFFAGLSVGNSSVTALRDGSIGALVGYFLARGLLKVVMISVMQVMEKRKHDMQQMMEEAARRADEEAEEQAKIDSERAEAEAEANAERYECEQRERERRNAA